jgi:hypothetical protein
MKIPGLVKPPKFNEFINEVEQELKNSYLQGMSDQVRKDCVHNLATQRAIYWACKTSAASHNLSVLIGYALILISGEKLLEFLTAAIKHWSGITP